MDADGFNQVCNWYLSGVTTDFILDNFCRTRSDFNGRLFSYETNLKHIFAEDCLYLVSSSLGEIGNNSFDHNLGYWQGEPGCLFIRESHYAFICDRGRGVRQSLLPVYSLGENDENYLSVAFRKVITGRAPEKRGNGLKFVAKNIVKCKLGLACRSGEDYFHLGINPDEISQKLCDLKRNNTGVITYLYWN